MNKALKHQFRLLGIALLMIPFCWVVVLLFILFAAPQLTSDESGQDWGQLLLLSLMFSAIPGLVMAWITYTLLNGFYSKK